MRRKQIFTAMDIVDLTSQQKEINIEVATPKTLEELPAVLEELPNVEEIELEISQMRQDWLKEKELLLKEAADEAAAIKDAALKQIAQEKEDWNLDLKLQQQQHTNKLEEEHRQLEEQLKSKEQQVEAELSLLENDSKEKGYKNGYEQGFSQGELEIKRLVAQLHRLINATLHRRHEMIASLESELIDLCSLMVRKVVKRLSSQMQDIIIYNLSEALQHLKSRSSVLVHVHPDDVQLVSSKKEEFIALIEKLQGLTFIEDSSLERGGCLIETDFGEIDASLAQQLRNIEDKVRLSRPLRTQLQGNDSPLNLKQYQETLEQETDVQQTHENGSTAINTQDEENN